MKKRGRKGEFIKLVKNSDITAKIKVAKTRSKDQVRRTLELDYGFLPNKKIRSVYALKRRGRKSYGRQWSVLRDSHFIQEDIYLMLRRKVNRWLTRNYVSGTKSCTTETLLNQLVQCIWMLFLMEHRYRWLKDYDYLVEKHKDDLSVHRFNRDHFNVVLYGTGQKSYCALNMVANKTSNKYLGTKIDQDAYNLLFVKRSWGKEGVSIQKGKKIVRTNFMGILTRMGSVVKHEHYMKPDQVLAVWKLEDKLFEKIRRSYSISKWSLLLQQERIYHISVDGMNTHKKGGMKAVEVHYDPVGRRIDGLQVHHVAVDTPVGGSLSFFQSDLDRSYTREGWSIDGKPVVHLAAESFQNKYIPVNWAGANLIRGYYVLRTHLLEQELKKHEDLLEGEPWSVFSLQRKVDRLGALGIAVPVTLTNALSEWFSISSDKNYLMEWFHPDVLSSLPKTNIGFFSCGATPLGVQTFYLYSSSGRIYADFHSGVQGLRRLTKHFALTHTGVQNYDIKSCHLFALKKLASEYGVEHSWLTDYLGARSGEAQPLQKLAKSHSLPMSDIKVLMLSILNGASLKIRLSTKVLRGKNSITDLLLKFNKDYGKTVTPKRRKEVVRELNATVSLLKRKKYLGEFLSIVHNVNLALLESPDKKELDADSGEPIDIWFNGHGMWYCIQRGEKYSGLKDTLKRKRGLMAFFLQSYETAFVHFLSTTEIENRYGYRVVGNEHDGLLVQGVLPQEAIDFANSSIGTEFKVVKKPFIDSNALHIEKTKMELTFKTFNIPNSVLSSEDILLSREIEKAICKLSPEHKDTEKARIKQFKQPRKSKGATCG